MRKESAQPPSGAGSKRELAPQRCFAADCAQASMASPDAAVAESDVLTFFPPSVFPKVEKHLMKFLCGLKSLAY